MLQGKELPNFTNEIDYAIENSKISFVCVPTPSNEREEIDLGYVKEVAKNIGKALNKEGYHAIAIKSTAVPQTREDLREEIESYLRDIVKKEWKYK